MDNLQDDCLETEMDCQQVAALVILMVEQMEYLQEKRLGIQMEYLMVQSLEMWMAELMEHLQDIRQEKQMDFLRVVLMLMLLVWLMGLLLWLNKKVRLLNFLVAKQYFHNPCKSKVMFQQQHMIYHNSAHNESQHLADWFQIFEHH